MGKDSMVDQQKKLTNDEIQKYLVGSLGQFYKVLSCEEVTGYKDVYCIKFCKDVSTDELVVCAKQTTFGGRNELIDEQRVQIQAKSINYLCEIEKTGKKVVILGICVVGSQVVICAWRATPSLAEGDNTVSKQIKIDVINNALREGIVQAKFRSKEEYAYAFTPPLLFFYLKNQDFLHKVDRDISSDEVDDVNGLGNKEIVQKIAKYIECRGFSYSSNLIENFYLSLKSKPFVILAGISGTGKTRLVKLFAEAIKAEYNLIPVRPDWSDSSDLFGHLDLQGRFIEGPITKIVKEASQPENLNKPYFICLDEMNLARVEYYLSDFLSIIETREKTGDGEITTKEFTLADGNTLVLTDNLYVVGTVNMDETTFPFSKKVLDRANTIEFSDVDLKVKNEIVAEQPVLDNVSNDFLCSKYVVLNDCKINDMTEEYRNKTIDKWIKQLSSINVELEKLDMHIGYRVRDELLFYMLYNNSCGENGTSLIDEKKAFNNQVMQKILPRIQGSNPELRKVLIDIFNICVFDEEKNKFIQDKDDETLLIDMKAAGGDSPLAKKIMTMIQRLSNDGYTKFWI